MRHPKLIKVKGHVYERAGSAGRRQASWYKEFGPEGPLEPPEARERGVETSDSAEEAKRHLKATRVLYGGGIIDLGDERPSEVFLGIFKDTTRFSAQRVVYAYQLDGTGHDAETMADEVIGYAAEDILEGLGEWPKKGYDIAVFGPFDPATAADIIRSDKHASKHVDIDEY